MLPKPPWVKISQIRTISIDRLGKRIVALGPEMLDQLVDGLLELIG
jgi:mRNA interferase MazF